MFHPSTVMVVHGVDGKEHHFKEPPDPQEFVEDQAVLGASSIQRRQKVFVQEEIILNHIGVAEKLDRVLQDFQVRNDETLLELAQYAHDHAISTTVETEERLGSHIRDCLNGVLEHYDASVKQQIEAQGVEFDRRLSCIEHNTHENVQASVVAAVSSLASNLETHFSDVLSTMETNLNGHTTTHALACENRLQFALKQVQDDLEAATDLQSEWIEKRLNAKLDEAKQAAAIEQQAHRRSCHIRFEEQNEKFSAKTASLAQANVDQIEQRLQNKLDDAMQAFQLKTKNDLEICLASAVKRLEQSQQVIKAQIGGVITSSASTSEEKLQNRLQASHEAATVKMHMLEQEIRDLKKAAVEKKYSNVRTSFTAYAC